MLHSAAIGFVHLQSWIKVILLLASLAEREERWFAFRQSWKVNHIPLFCEQSKQ